MCVGVWACVCVSVCVYLCISLLCLHVFTYSPCQGKFLEERSIKSCLILSCLLFDFDAILQRSFSKNFISFSTSMKHVNNKLLFSHLFFFNASKMCIDSNETLNANCETQ